MTVQKLIAGLVPKMRSMPQPIIAAVNGAASGGGLALALASDVRIAAASARFNVAFVRVGLSGCDIGVSWMLPRLIGASRAFELLLTGRLDRRGRSRPHRARHAGRRPTATVVDAALETAELIVANSPFGVRMTKEVMWSQLEIGSLQAGIDLENRTQVLSSFTGDLDEAMRRVRREAPAAVHRPSRRAAREERHDARRTSRARHRRRTGDRQGDRARPRRRRRRRRDQLPARRRRRGRDRRRDRAARPPRASRTRRRSTTTTRASAMVDAVLADFGPSTSS